MKNKYRFVVLLLAAILFAGMGLTELYLSEDNKEATKEMTIVTSFYPMYIAAMNVIGDCETVTLENLSEPQTGCLHDYQLTPADMKLLSTADVFIVNGGGIESFLSDVAEQYPELTIINACSDVDLIEDNAHAWMNISDYMQQITTIEEGLAQIDLANADIYSSNADVYLAKLESLQEEADALVPQTTGKNIIIFHEAYAYVSEQFGMHVSYVMDLDEERQVSAGEVADVISEITDNDVPVVLAEELYGKDMGDTVEKETNVNVVYLNTMVRGDYDPDSYIDDMEENIQQIKEAFPNENIE